MKKLLITVSILLIAASCSKQPVAVTPTPTPAPAPSPSTPTPPPTSDVTTYTSPAKYGFTIQYPTGDGFSTDYNQVKSLSYIPVCDQNMVACVYLIRETFKATNFDGAAVSVNVDPSLTTQAKCYNFAVSTNEAQKPVADVTINGIVFKSATGGGGAAGHLDKLQVYRNFHNNMCIEISQDLAETKINNYPKGQVQAIDENEIWQQLQTIVNTFKWNPANALPYSPAQLPVKYTNAKYGFVFSLPTDWQGYTIETTTWSEQTNDAQKPTMVTGPQIMIVNPKNSTTTPYEKIPVMVFTRQQWDEIVNGQLTSAAPIQPMEFDRNANYVFALPPRFDYDYATGYEEAEKIVSSEPLKAY